MRRRLRGSSGLDLCRRLTEHDPGCRVLLLSVYDDEQYLYQALRAGASGYLLKRVTGEELVRSLEQVHAGETVVDATMAARVAYLTRPGWTAESSGPARGSACPSGRARCSA